MAQIYTPQVSKLKNLKHLFIELTAQNCNQRCKKCYINFPYSYNIKDFISLDKIKKALFDTANEELDCIYLTGAEPMTHPDFNIILRLCLKRTNVCIFTNATFINEKKARFLKKVEDESEYKIFFKFSFTHYNEQKNDDIKFRGSYRQNIYAAKCLDKYDFITIMCINNFYNEDRMLLSEEFMKIILNNSFKNSVIQITPWISEKSQFSEDLKSINNYDCSFSRTLTKNGIYSCPFLTNDYRGRLGSNLQNYSETVILETNFCSECMKNKETFFLVNIS